MLPVASPNLVTAFQRRFAYHGRVRLSNASSMRLRSSQFVFLLLIACSVQIREEHALRWMQQAISGDSGRSFTLREASQTCQPRSFASDQAWPPSLLGLLPAALAARQAPWAMRQPASDFTSVAVHTGLLRA